MLQDQQPEQEVNKIKEDLQLLQDFIDSNPDPRELKRALAVRMLIEGVGTLKIQTILGVSPSFVSKWKVRFALEGVEGLKLAYQGASRFLTPEQRAETIAWLQSKSYWHLQELETYLEQHYNVVFKSKKSYYQLFAEAGISWKKSQKTNPKADPEQVEVRRREIRDLLDQHREDIEAGRLIVYMVDECHLLWGDICGYIWGATHQRIELPITNERERHTFYGALNIYTEQFITQSYEQANTQNTIVFLQYLQAFHPGCRILVIWDGASYHRSKEFKAFLSDTNQGLPATDWPLTCERFAPHDPSQNSVEDVWLQAKNFLRQYWPLCRSFAIVKWLFMFITQHQTFHFSKLDLYRSFQFEFTQQSVGFP